MKVMEIRNAWGLDNPSAESRTDPTPGDHEVVVELGAASIKM